MHAVPPFAARYARQLPQVVSDLLTTPALPPNLTLSRSGNAMMFDSTGKLTYAPANMLLNSATLSTQTVTVAVGVSYIVSFQGTGSITLSGAASATISGTGASDRVYQKVTATTTSLVCTVSGSVTSAQVEPVTYQTTPAPYVATTSAAYYGPRFDYDPSTLAARGLLVEATATNLVVNSNTTSNGTWAVSFAAKTSTNNSDPMGTNTAVLVTADGSSNVHSIAASGATTLVSYTSGTTYTLSYYVSPGTTSLVQLTGSSGVFGASQYANFSLSGAGSVTQSSGVTANIVSVGNSWYRISITLAATSTTTGNAGGLIFIANGTDGRTPTNTSSSTLYVACSQVETGTVATSYIPTGSASVARAAESLTSASYSTQPAILQYRPTPNGTRARKIISPYSGISSETGEWLEKIAIYATSTPTALLNQFLNVNGQL